MKFVLFHIWNVVLAISVVNKPVMADTLLLTMEFYKKDCDVVHGFAMELPSDECAIYTAYITDIAKCYL